MLNFAYSWLRPPPLNKIVDNFWKGLVGNECGSVPGCDEP